MYKVIKISGTEYKIEYSIEASLYGEMTEKVISMMSAIGDDGDGADVVKQRIKEMSNIPQVAISMFYGGLLEHHGTEEGDGLVPDMSTAKRLLISLIKENSDNDLNNFFGVIEMLMEQMGEDGFFKLIGLEAMLAPAENKVVEMPQDHKKKARPSEK